MILKRAGWLGAVVVLSMPAFAHGQPGVTPQCPHAAPPESAPFDSTRLDILVGSYNVVLVDTADVRGGIRFHLGQLTLWLADSAAPGRGAAKPGLHGSYVAAPPDTGDVWQRMARGEGGSPGVAWQYGSLRLGKMGDDTGINLFIRHVSASEFRGDWSQNAGIGIIVDFTGTRRPEPAGFFCATRHG
jgi:hypothetical protein